MLRHSEEGGSQDEKRLVCMLVFKGIQKTTLIDFPGEVACTLFLPKCNFRCPYCYNAKLVFNRETGVTITEAQFFKFLEQRRGFLDGVCITGGEPTLHSALPGFCKKVKKKGFLVKVDTNGTKPRMLAALIKDRLVDYISMDIKAPLEKYDSVASVSVDKGAIEESVRLIRESAVAHEFRTTVLPKFLGKEDLFAVGQWLEGSRLYFLQQFSPEGDLIDKSLKREKRYSEKELRGFASMLKPFFGRVDVRNV
jgi:pyruvate formate lyase activating enzyme